MERNLELPQEVSRSLNPRSLNLILLPTETCNFRCIYCYEDFKQGLMPNSVVSGIKKLLVARAADLVDLTIGWFGGEPLLARKLIYDLSQFCQQLQREHVNLNYSAAMSTNAYLLDADTLSRLVSYGITDYQISLDGPRELHDQSRVTKRGGGTFDQIWRNLLTARDSKFDLKVTLRLHYRRESFTKLFPLIELLNNELAGDARFQVFFKAISRLGGPKDDLIDPISDFNQGIIEDTLRSMLCFPDRTVIFDTYVCYAAAANSLIIRSNGDLSKCTVALNNEVNRIGHLNSDGSVTIDQEKFKQWIEPVVSCNKRAMACPYGHILTNQLADGRAVA